VVQQDISAKAQGLLKALVEHYIADGQPVASRILAESATSPVSPATVRNIIADLEEQGFVNPPHTSAGRIPTPKGYRFFVDSLVKVEPLAGYDMANLARNFDPDMTAPELVESASGILSEVTRMAGLVTIPKREQVLLRHVEFLNLRDKRVLVIMVLDDHEVQNRVIHTKEQYTEVQLKESSHFINHEFAGLSLRRIRSRLISSMQTDRESLNSLMKTTLEVAGQAFDSEEEEGDFIVAGQENLFEFEALEDLRDLFKAFSMKGDILHLLDRCLDTEGVQLFIGDESGYELLDECSVVTSPYQIDGEQVGVLGVIGPTRMAYDRVIPVVDATAKVLSAALESLRR